MFSQAKLILAGLVAAVVGVFALVFRSRGKKIEEQEKVIDVKEEEIKVQEVVHEGELDKKDLEIDLEKKDKKIAKKVVKNKKTTKSKIKDTPDNEEYEVKV